MLTPTERAALVTQYGRGYAEIAAALEGATDAELDHVPGGGGWTARQIVHHLADGEATSYVRLRRLLAEDRPVIQAYDEEEFARRLRYDRPIAASLAVIAAVRQSSADLLATLTEDDWQRQGVHSESGPYSITTWLEIYAAHAEEHARQIERAARVSATS